MFTFCDYFICIYAYLVESLAVYSAHTQYKYVNQNNLEIYSVLYFLMESFTFAMFENKLQ